MGREFWNKCSFKKCSLCPWWISVLHLGNSRPLFPPFLRVCFFITPSFRKNNVTLVDAEGWSMTQLLQLQLRLERSICSKAVLSEQAVHWGQWAMWSQYHTHQKPCAVLPCERLSGKPDAISKQLGQSLIVGVTVTDVMLTVFFPMGALYLAVVNIPYPIWDRLWSVSHLYYIETFSQSWSRM